MASLTGSLSATLSGTLGQTLTGQGLFTGTNSAGVAFSYQGNVTLAANGQLVFNYGGNWNSTTSSQTGTGSGMIQQIPGTSFTETVTGTAQHSVHFHPPRDELSHRDEFNCHYCQGCDVPDGEPYRRQHDQQHDRQHCRDARHGQYLGWRYQHQHRPG